MLGVGNKVNVYSVRVEISPEGILGGGQPSMDGHLATKIRCAK